MTDAPTDRAALRTELRRRRKAQVEALPASVRSLAFRVLPSPVLAQIPPGARIALYLSMASEAPTANLIDFLHERGYALCLPRIDASIEGHMDFCAWEPGQALIPGSLRIPQPGPDARIVEPDVIFTPLVGFDKDLNRIGNGAGYYDRAFERLPGRKRIGLAWSSQMVDALPVQPWDIPLHMIITEQSIIERVID
jgi:5-formyltetrahydrofolate cyclo-ligase